MKKSDLQNKKAIAFYGLTNTASVEILAIDDIGERVYYALHCGERHAVQFAKIRENDNGDPYFKSSNWGRIALSDCMKVEG